jgi:FlaA1/EpsC-like NDP-sugar epimerase
MRRINQVILDIIVFSLAVFGAYLIRFERLPEGQYLRQFLLLLPFLVLARVLLFYFFRVYSIVWKYVSIRDVLLIIESSLSISALLIIARIASPSKLAFMRVPFGVIAIEYIMVTMGASGIRMLRRLAYEMQKNKKNIHEGNDLKRVLLIGAGDAGNLAVRELKKRADLGMTVVGFVDDDAKKFNTVIQGLSVLGSSAQIPALAKRMSIDEAIITIANASSRDIRRIVDICKDAGIKVKIIPSIFEMLDDNIRISKIREINIDDLLGRSAVSFDSGRPEVVEKYRNKRIMVTGAGGSIGSELSRQLAAMWARELILLDKDENSIYEIESELRTTMPHCPTIPIITDIRNRPRLKCIIERFRPQIVFHAAAHKHVPLMECNISEAILNNIVGTRNVAELADAHGVEDFVYISTDKAINPTSIMGATKKIGEIIVQGIAAGSKTRFSCVRFGNVLGSRGSVVPLFRKQIAAGGPVTVTHSDIRRYFMSIAEAVQLIIQVGTLGNGGQIFVLDMGQPIKVEDLARDLIRISGYKESDIGIQYIGLRPGEKLYEEILVDEEKTKATEFQKIFIAPAGEVNSAKFLSVLENMIRAAEQCCDKEVVDCLNSIDIGYQGYTEWNHMH